jgi:hypothetical protein
MDDAKFDRLARAFAETLTRRRTVLLLSATPGMLGQDAARAFQLGPAICREEGAVCTVVSSCCDGLTCVTSAINTSYGICVPGDGGMVSSGTTLISPFSETAMEEASALMQAVASTPAPAPEAERQAADPESERQARAADSVAREETGHIERKTRLATKRATLRTRKDEQRARQREDRESDEAATVPQLEVRLLLRKSDPDSGGEGDSRVLIEVVRVTNRDAVDVVLTRIETIKGSSDGVDLPASQFTLAPADSFSFVSGLPTEDNPDTTKDQLRWLDKAICDGAFPKQGYRVTAAFGRGRDTHDFVVLCPRPDEAGVDETLAATPSRKRKKNGEQKHKRSGQHQKTKKR